MTLLQQVYVRRNSLLFDTFCFHEKVTLIPKPRTNYLNVLYHTSVWNVKRITFICKTQ